MRSTFNLHYYFRGLAALASLLAAGTAQAQSSCDAWYRFDGDLADASGNGYEGTMFGRDGAAAEPGFGAGISGQALHLDGAAALRAYLDLHYDSCPQVTLTAWVRIDSKNPEETAYVLSTGVPGIGLYYSGRSVVLTGSGNGLSHREGLRDDRAWFFVAGVYDFDAGTYRLYFRNRIREGSLPSKPKEPEGVIYIGTRGDSLANTARDLYLDEVRIFGRALSDEQVRQVAARVSGQPWLTAVLLDSTASGGAATRPDLRDHIRSDDPPLGPATLPVGELDTSATSGGAVTGLELPDDVRPNQPPLGPTTLAVGEEGGNSGAPLLEAPATAGTSPGTSPVETNLTLPEDDPVREFKEQTAPRSAPPPTPGAKPLFEEIYRNDRGGPVRTVDLVRPGSSVMQTITYEEIDGLAITEGDIILGPVADLDRWAEAVEPEASGGTGVRRQGLNAIANTDMLWRNGRIPFVISAGLSATARNNINGAINAFNAATGGNITWVPRTSESDFVQFAQGTDPVACSSAVGRQGGRQDINLSTSNRGCTVATLLHEMLHAAGVWHEQSRPDRDTYVDVLIDNVQTEPQDRRHNFEKTTLDDGLGVGEYNFRSIMHYSPFAFGVSCIPGPPSGSAIDADCRCTTNDGQTVCVARTIRSRVPGKTINRDFSMASDLADILTLYPGVPGPQLGLEWGDGYYATATAVGDVDGDGLAEIVVGRFANDNARVLLYDDILAGSSILDTAGEGWGPGIEVTDVAVGDVDGDGDMEIGVSRRAGSSNRWYIYDFKNGELMQIRAGGDDWDSSSYATAIAFGDIDNDGRDEFAVGRRASQHGRYYLFNDAAATVPFERLAIGGTNWDGTHYTTGLAFGDVDNDGRDELGVTRNAASGMRYEIIKYANGAFSQLHADGHDWDGTHYGTAIAFGNVDNDGGEEAIVGRRASSGSRFHVVDDASGGFAILDRGGDLWGSNYWVVGVDLADIDNNGRDEVVVARNAGEAGRYYLFKDRLRDFEPVLVNGEPFRGASNFSGVGATDISAGDMDGDGKADLSISYDQRVFGRMRWEAISLKLPAN